MTETEVLDPIASDTPRAPDISRKYSRLGKAEIRVVVVDEGYAEILPARIVEHHFLQFKYRGRLVKKIILNDATILEYGQTFMWVFPSRKRFLVWFINAKDSMGTHDPCVGSLNDEEAIQALDLAQTLTASGIAQSLAKAVKGKAVWLEYIPWIVVCIISIVAFFYINGG